MFETSSAIAAALVLTALLLRNLVEIRQELRLAHLQRCRDLCTVL